MLFLRPIVIRTQSDADKMTVNRYDAIRAQQQSMMPDHSTMMRVNDAPIVPAIRPDTRIDQSVPLDPGTGSVPMINSAPVPDLRPAAAAAVPASAAASAATK